MSNPAVMVLAEVKQGFAGFDRLQIEDNIGEAIHLHVGPVRIDLSVNEFLSLAAGMRNALDATGRLAPYKVDQFDPMFLLACGPLLERLEGIAIEERCIDDLRCLVHRSRRLGTYSFVPVTETPAYRLLESRDESFLRYEQDAYWGTKNRERLMSLSRNVEEFGYPDQGRHIILFDGQDLVRDGQHRLAVLRHLRGNARIPVMVFAFSTAETLPRIPWKNYASLPLRFAHDMAHRLRKRFT